MKLALLSDIHANIQALDACLTHARAQGAGRFALLGDLVGYGADPVAVVEQVKVLVADGALVIKGNHDELAVTARPPGLTPSWTARTGSSSPHCHWWCKTTRCCWFMPVWIRPSCGATSMTTRPLRSV